MRKGIGCVVFLAMLNPLWGALPPRPEEIPGTLFICGGGKLPDNVRERFVELAGGEKARIVVIPTASADAEKPNSEELFLTPWRKLKPSSVELLHTLNRKTADDPAFAKKLDEATAVWFSGGRQELIVDIYRGTLTGKKLTDFLKQGKVIGGTSAGAAIMSELMIVDGNEVPRTGPGMGFLPGFVVDQHFVKRNRIGRLNTVLKNNPGHAGLGIDESTAVIVQGRTIQVLGESVAIVCQNASKDRPAVEQRMKSGEKADLFALRRAALARASDSFPPEKLADAIVPKGALVLGGGGLLSDEVGKRFLELAGGNDSLLLIVATAGDEPVPVEPFECQWLRRNGAKNIQSHFVRKGAIAKPADFLNSVKQARGVWFSDGPTWLLLDAFQGTEAEKLVREVLTRGGVVGGSGGAASSLSNYVPRSHPLDNTVVMAEGYERGLGFLTGVAIDHHFFAQKRNADMRKVVGAFPQFLGIGIDERTAAIVQGSTLEVSGVGKIAVYDGRRKSVNDEADCEFLETGTKYDLQSRKRLAQ